MENEKRSTDGRLHVCVAPGIKRKAQALAKAQDVPFSRYVEAALRDKNARNSKKPRFAPGLPTDRLRKEPTKSL